MVMLQEIFRRTEVLLGREAMERLATIRVILFGVGGVGSWCAESLIRTGVTHLTIVDNDHVCATNVNRQLMATTLTIGQVKVEALKERLLTINPDAEIVALEREFNETTAADFHLDSYDYVVDAIDSLKDKALLILLTTRSGASLFSSMGAALKLDPTRISVAEFWKVKGDPLARALRNRFKHDKQFPHGKFLCVYSDESIQGRRSPSKELFVSPKMPESPDSLESLENSSSPRSSFAPPSSQESKGSLVHITAIFGFTLAGLVIQNAIKTLSCPQ